MATSTFNFARQVISWLNTVDPSINCLEDDIMPLCVGPMKKILQFSMSNFRSKDDISQSVKKREKAIKLLKSREQKRIDKEKEIISQRTYDSLRTQRDLRISLNHSILQMRLAEGKKTSKHDDHDAHETREKLIKDTDLNRNKELDLWTRTIEEINDVSQIQTVESMITDLKKGCIEALSSSSKSFIPLKQDHITEKNVFSVGDDTISEKGKASSDVGTTSKGTTFHKQSDEELHKSVVSEYLAAARMSHSIKTKMSEKITVPEENKEVFKNALAVELAYTEKSCLKKIVSEVIKLSYMLNCNGRNRDFTIDLSFCI
jgi:hypothetical protein